MASSITQSKALQRPTRPFKLSASQPSCTLNHLGSYKKVQILLPLHTLSRITLYPWDLNLGIIVKAPQVILMCTQNGKPLCGFGLKYFSDLLIYHLAPCSLCSSHTGLLSVPQETKYILNSGLVQ